VACHLNYITSFQQTTKNTMYYSSSDEDNDRELMPVAFAVRGGNI